MARSINLRFLMLLFMAWLLLLSMELRNRLFMGIPGIFTFHAVPSKTVKSQKNGVKNGVHLWIVCQTLREVILPDFRKAVDFQIQKCYIIGREQPPTRWVDQVKE